MAVIKAINSHAALGTALRYITRDSKTEERLIGGVNCDPRNALWEMMETKRAWRKTGGREYKHFIQSFPPDESVTADEANQIAEELITRSPMFEGYEVAYATHVDRHHVHTHIIVNSVSFVDGKKFRQSKRDLQDFKDLSDEILREHGLSICEKAACAETGSISSFRMALYRILEQHLSGKKHSWMVDVLQAVSMSIEQSHDKDSFIQAMRTYGIETQWTHRKHIVFIDSNGNKVRASTLSRTFKVDISKEVLENELKGLHAGEYDSGQHEHSQDSHSGSARSAVGRNSREFAGVGEPGAQTELGNLRAQLEQLSGSVPDEPRIADGTPDREAAPSRSIERDIVPAPQSIRRSVHSNANAER